jgi:hypothetical protein
VAEEIVNFIVVSGVLTTSRCGARDGASSVERRDAADEQPRSRENNRSANRPASVSRRQLPPR